MMKIFFFLSVLTFFINAHATPTISRTIDLLDRDYVALYNCDIYRMQQAYDDCRTLKRAFNGQTDWSNEGYATPCSRFDGQNFYLCRDLAHHLLRGNHPIKCQSDYISRGLERDRCDIAKEAYEAGQFQRSCDDCSDCYSRERSTRRLETYTYDSEYNRCYQGAKNAWEESRTTQQQRGKEATAAGIGLFTFGRILDMATNNTDAEIFGDVAGGIASGFGAALAAYGLFEWSSASYRPPYEDPSCRKHYTTQSRQVIIQQQQCTTTRYESHSWTGSSYYFQTVCQTRTFYSFEENSQFWY